MIVSKGMQKVIARIIKSKVESDYVSPNLVAEVAWKCKVNLTSDQVVYISDNF
jgi:hypothetical protein